MGYIKDYDGGTLMECVIVQRLPHTRLPAMLQAQKQALDSCIRQYSKSHVVREGLTAFQDGARHVEIASIPGSQPAWLCCFVQHHLTCLHGMQEPPMDIDHA